MRYFLCLLSCIIVLNGCITQLPILHTIDISKTNFTKPLKRATSCEKYILLIFGPIGDMSINEAAKQANITQIKWIRYTRQDYLVYSQNCIHIHGI